MHGGVNLSNTMMGQCYLTCSGIRGSITPLIRYFHNYEPDSDQCSVKCGSSEIILRHCKGFIESYYN